MSVRNKEIISATVDAQTSDAFNVQGTRTVNAGTLLIEETVTIEYTHDGILWQALVLNGVLQQVSIAHSAITILGPGLFRCTKSITASPVSVNLWITGAEQ